MRRNRKKRQIDRFRRHQLIRFIADAITASGGTVYFKEPIVVCADDIFGQVPLSIRKISAREHNENEFEGFSITDEYSDIHLDIQAIKQIAQKIASK